MDDNPLQTPVQFVRGAGPERATLLAKLGLKTAEDLLWYVPRDLLDLSDVRSVGDLEEGTVQTVFGKVLDVDSRELSGGRTLVAVLLGCEGGRVRGVWFNQLWPLKKFTPGSRVLFSGKPKRRSGQWEIAHPKVQSLDERQDEDQTLTGGVHPRYGLTEGLAMHEMRRIVRAAVDDFAHYVTDPLPQAFRDKHKLPALQDAVRRLHQPEGREQFDEARRRLIFDDLLEFQLGLALRRRAWKREEHAPRLPTTPKIDARIRRLFPFRLTAGQDRAVHEIAADLDSGRAMHRLLQADVGAGKTAVALYAMLVAVAAGYQAVLMAPTEVLARQHWTTIEEALAHSRVTRQLLTGQLTTAERGRALEQIRAGDVQLVVGTQAVIQEDVAFHHLGVAVVDEQHKFGVQQRARFAAGKNGDTDQEPSSPHVLVMTATPIPRTLCLTQFGDLDVTTIDDLPPGRQRVVTSCVTGDGARQRMWTFLRKQLAAGRQAYVVCPRIDAGEDDDRSAIAGAEQVHAQLASGELEDFRVDLVHGRMDADRKNEAMRAFREGQTQVLVSTTVIEVGVDVPNATLMVVYDAERFGLSQIHQLRGRIRRGRFQGYCFLLSESESSEARQRLAALEETADGFKIAEADFSLRGPGDVLGTRQHGRLPLKVADPLRDEKVLSAARKAAFALVESAGIDTPDFAPLKLRVLDRFGKLMDLPQSG